MLRSPFVFVSHVIIQSVFFVFFPSFLLCNPPLPKPFFLFLLPCFLSSLSLVFSSFSSPFQRILFASFSPFSIPFHLYLPYRFLMLDPRPPQSFSPFLRAELRFQKPTQNAAWVSGVFFLFLSLCCHPNKLCITSKCTFGNSYKTHIWYPLFVLLQSLISHNITKCHDVTGRAEQWMW